MLKLNVGIFECHRKAIIGEHFKQCPCRESNCIVKEILWSLEDNSVQVVSSCGRVSHEEPDPF